MAEWAAGVFIVSVAIDVVTSSFDLHRRFIAQCNTPHTPESHARDVFVAERVKHALPDVHVSRCEIDKIHGKSMS